MKPATAPQKGVNTAFSGARPALTFRLQVALDEQQRLQRAARIRQLREDSPYTQEALADRIGVKLRSYQKWEEGGGIEWDHMEALADLHAVDVRWIHKGEAATPDVMGEINEGQLDRIEQKLDALLEWAETAEIESAEDRLPEQDAEGATGAGR